MLLFSINGKIIYNLNDVKFNTKDDISNFLNIPSDDFYLLYNGKLVESVQNPECPVHVVPRLFGGKGGFGSMLRAIGAQIEKTTNREACRDLSGRRLRDINEEKRLKNWINQQAEREKQAEDRRQKKLERLCQKPKHEFKDEDYDKARSELPDKVEDALEQGLKASCSGTSSGTKRKQSDEKTKKKKAKLWLGSEDELSSDEDDKSVSSLYSEESTKGTDCTPQISDSEIDEIIRHRNKKYEDQNVECEDIIEKHTNEKLEKQINEETKGNEENSNEKLEQDNDTGENSVNSDENSLEKQEKEGNEETSEEVEKKK